MSPLISVIMPAYNAEAFIAQAIESVLAQTFTDWELLIGDDFSTDQTLAVCRNYASNDVRIRIINISHRYGEANGVRQELLANAKGQWIHELDADDVIDPDVLLSLLTLAKHTSADAVTQRSVCMTESGEHINESIPNEGFDYNRVFTGAEACRLTIPGWQINMNGGLFSRQLLLRAETQRRQFVANNDDHLIYDDELLSRFVLINANVVAVSPAIYWRREASTSITRQYSLRLFDHVRVQRLVERFAECHFPDLVDAAELNLWWKVVAHACQYEYHKHEISSADCKTLNALIYSYWSTIDNARVRPQLPLWRRLLMTHSYFVFRKFIKLRCLFR